MEIALFKNLKYGYTSVHEVSNLYEKDPEYVRLTEIYDVEFVELSKEETTNKEIACLRSCQNSLRAEMQDKVDTIETRIQELLALPSLGAEHEQE